MSSIKKNARIPRVIDRNEHAKDYRWVRLQKLRYLDEDSKERLWEMAERTTRVGDVDGVAIIPLLIDDVNKVRDEQIILVSQFRPPVDAFVLELPAGLVDEGETPETCAVRELREETGYVGKVVSISPVVFSDPGLTNANLQYVTVKCMLSRNRNPEQNPEELECITVHKVPKSTLLDGISQLAEENGFKIDARLHALALGYAAKI